MAKRYDLKVRVNNNGEEELLTLTSGGLVEMQKYIAFCRDANDLLFYLPKGEDGEYCKEFIESIIIKPIENAFVLMDAQGNEIEKIFKKDIELIAVTAEDLANQLYSKYNLSYDSYITNCIPDENLEVLKFIENKMKSKMYIIQNKKSFLDYEEEYLNADKPEYNRLVNGAVPFWVMLGDSKKIFKDAIKLIYDDQNERIDLIKFAKEKLIVLPPVTENGKKEAFSGLKKIGPIYKQIKKNVGAYRDKFDSKKVDPIKPEIPIKPITERQIIKYNIQKNKEEHIDNDPELEIRKKLYNAKLEISKTEPPIFHMQSELLKVQKEDLNRKIEELEYELYKQENKQSYYFNDAGEVIDEEMDKEDRHI